MFELYLLTFNCARNLVDPKSLAPSLFDALPPNVAVPDILAVSLQEISPIAYSFLGGSYLTPYFEQITATVDLAVTLRSDGNEHLQHVATRSLGMTGLMIFARPRTAERIRWIQTAGVGVGAWNMGNKGAIAMRIGLSCPGASEMLLTIAAAHLAPMESNVPARNNDWENIVRNLVFVNDATSGYSASETVPLLSSGLLEPPEDGSGLFHGNSHVFFAGDLNYRTSDLSPGPDAHKSYPQPASPESSKHYSHLLTRDQLIREKEANRTLHGLQEMPINFPPTYKYSMHAEKTSKGDRPSHPHEEEHWLWAKHRYPSWCDRILYRAGQLKPHIYTALPIQPTSDHRPVALSLRVGDHPVAQPAELSYGDGSAIPPFPLNPEWKSRKDTARRLEVVVGILSYLTLTRKGNAIVVTFAGIAFAIFWVAKWISIQL